MNKTAWPCTYVVIWLSRFTNLYNVTLTDKGNIVLGRGFSMGYSLRQMRFQLLTLAQTSIKELCNIGLALQEVQSTQCMVTI